MNWWLIYRVNGESGTPVGIIDAETPEGAAVKARKDHFDYQVEKPVMWGKFHRPKAVAQLKADGEDWDCVIELNRRRRAGLSHAGRLKLTKTMAAKLGLEGTGYLYF